MRLKMLVATVAAAAALAAAPAYAETVNSGYVGLAAANFDSDGFDAQSYELDGAVAFALGGNWGAQLDAEYARVESDLADDDGISGTAHVFHRTDTHLIGGYFGASDADDVTVYGGGVEGDLYRGDWTIGGRVGYATDDSDVDSDVWSVDGRVKYFYSDSFMVAGGIGYDRISFDTASVDDVDVITVGVNTEYQFTGPVSVFGGLAYADEDDTDGVTAVQIGVRFNFNTDTLIERDRTGASLQGFQSDLFGVL